MKSNRRRNEETRATGTLKGFLHRYRRKKLKRGVLTEES